MYLEVAAPPPPDARSGREGHDALNSLGFVERRLYLFKDCFTTISVETLLGEGISLENLTDDCLGRTL